MLEKQSSFYLNSESLFLYRVSFLLFIMLLPSFVFYCLSACLCSKDADFIWFVNVKIKRKNLNWLKHRQKYFISNLELVTNYLTGTRDSV